MRDFLIGVIGCGVPVDVRGGVSSPGRVSVLSWFRSAKILRSRGPNVAVCLKDEGSC